MAPEQGPQGQAMEHRESLRSQVYLGMVLGHGKVTEANGGSGLSWHPQVCQEVEWFSFGQLDTNWSCVEERTSIEELPPSDWPVGTSAGVFS